MFGRTGLDAAIMITYLSARLALPLGSLAVLAGCALSHRLDLEEAMDAGLADAAECDDADGDGASDVLCGGTDCQDDDPTIGPSVTESCNERDDDCDGLVDEDACSDVLDVAGSCALLRDGSIRCFHPALLAGEPVREVAGIRNAVAISDDCAVEADGRVVCWCQRHAARGSRPPFYDIGPSRCREDESFFRAESIDGLASAIAVDHYSSASNEFGCSLRSTGQVDCWGSNSDGQLGRGFESDDDSPLAPGRVPGVDDATSVTVGRGYACVLRRSGQVACWGRGDVLGRGFTEDGSTPQNVPGLTDVRSLASSRIGETVCAADGAGDIRCWGNNGGGLVTGEEGGGSFSAPYRLVSATRAAQVAVGWGVGLFADGSGDLYVWGLLVPGVVGVGRPRFIVPPESVERVGTGGGVGNPLSCGNRSGPRLSPGSGRATRSA